MIKAITVALISFVFAAVFGIFLIPLLHRLKFGQEIREEGPKWHQKKSGTPTMGGIIFIAASVISSVIGGFLFGINRDVADIKALISLLGISLGFGIVGFLDDYIKVILKRNLGLRAGQKFSLQFLVALISAVWMVAGGVVNTEIAIPFSGISVDVGYIVYIPFVILVMLAAVNSVNLTDGLDGLATCITLVICVFYCIVSTILGNNPLALFSAILIGGLSGFLLYNKFPAKVFMGDTGSLFLGGAVSAMAIYMKNPLLLLIVGLVYVIEALSVIIQVTWFKKTGKRIFKMSPIHHHFEMCGWSEVKIVTVFSAVTAALCVLGLAATGI
ncbi:MAG: phospho-N-acetylmuramoyl-pentapeptide-transferase [Clostridia bacterium]|nr:phospho-N-acetylmuramoyl-pentapeptide-transferase [Clostridia bacterium]